MFGGGVEYDIVVDVVVCEPTPDIVTRLKYAHPLANSGFATAIRPD